MNGTELLKEFAKTQGIDVKEVDKFLEKYNNPKTLDDLLSLPNDMLNHIDYISFVDDPLKSFIRDGMWCERYMLIDLDRVVEILEDSKYYAEECGDIERLEELLEVEKHIIEIKFGSVVYDW